MIGWHKVAVIQVLFGWVRESDFRYVAFFLCSNFTCLRA